MIPCLIRIEGESKTPDTVGGIKPQFLHIGVTRFVKRVHARTTEQRTELLEQTEVRKQFILYLLGKFLVFGVKGRMKLNLPDHL